MPKIAMGNAAKFVPDYLKGDIVQKFVRREHETPKFVDYIHIGLKHCNIR